MQSGPATPKWCSLLSYNCEVSPVDAKVFMNALEGGTIMPSQPGGDLTPLTASAACAGYCTIDYNGYAAKTGFRPGMYLWQRTISRIEFLGDQKIPLNSDSVWEKQMRMRCQNNLFFIKDLVDAAQVHGVQHVLLVSHQSNRFTIEC